MTIVVERGTYHEKQEKDKNHEIAEISFWENPFLDHMIPGHSLQE